MRDAPQSAVRNAMRTSRWFSMSSLPGCPGTSSSSTIPVQPPPWSQITAARCSAGNVLNAPSRKPASVR